MTTTTHTHLPQQPFSPNTPRIGGNDRKIKAFSPTLYPRDSMCVG